MAGVVGKLSALVMLLLLVFVQSSQAKILLLDGLHAGTGFVGSKLATQSVSNKFLAQAHVTNELVSETVFCDASMNWCNSRWSEIKKSISS